MPKHKHKSMRCREKKKGKDKIIIIRKTKYFSSYSLSTFSHPPTTPYINIAVFHPIIALIHLHTYTKKYNLNEGWTL